MQRRDDDREAGRPVFSPDPAGTRPYFAKFDPTAVPSPCFVVDRAAVEYNLSILAEVAEASGATILLALKAFAMPALFDLVGQYLAGTCCSGVHEARLGYEGVGKQVHAFAPAYTTAELAELLQIADHIVFNSCAQWQRHRAACLTAQASRPALSFGIRVNPEHSEGTTPIYDPAGPFSRLGTVASQLDPSALDGISGIHMHTLCEQDSHALERTIEALDARFGSILARPEIRWLNLGGGHHITKPDYDRAHLIRLVRELAARYNVQVFLEPGEAIAIHSGVLVATVLDLIWNGMNIAILDTSATCHMPDTLEMPYQAEIWGARALGMPATTGAAIATEAHVYRLGGQTCLAGDVMGDYGFSQPLRIGQRLVFDDMAHYTMVKTTTFNGIRLPAIATYDSRTGETTVHREFGYAEFRERLG